MATPVGVVGLAVWLDQLVWLICPHQLVWWFKPHQLVVDLAPSVSVCGESGHTRNLIEWSPT